MFSARRSTNILALVLLATSAWAQGLRSGPPCDTVTGDLKPRPAEAGYAFCSGDDEGTMCPAKNLGAPGHGCENSLGLGGGLLWADGMARTSRDTLVFQVAYLPRRSTVFFLQSTEFRDGKLRLPFGDGLMCMGRSVMNLGVADPVGGHAMFPNFGGSSFATLSTIGRIPPEGGTRYYQALYRDRGGYGTKATFNLSNAWAVEWIP